MSFTSITFLIFFVLIFFLYYFLGKSKNIQNTILLIASYFFYGYADWRLLPLLLISTLIFYVVGLGIEKQKSISIKKTFTGIAVFLGVGLLLYFKYANFFLQSFATLFSTFGLKTNWETFSIVMPLGISFFTFKLISYIVDIQKGYIKPETNFISFATYISFFPTILSGPIDRSCNFLPQLSKKRIFNYTLAVDGCRQILWGLFKKMVVADGLSIFINRDIEHSNGSTLLLVAIFYSIQIYADFSGYSDIAIGIGKFLGIKITPNFRYPYFSQSVNEFWRRWHISLLTWFRYYLYFPLGGSHCSKVKCIRNTFIVFLVSGLWHGANWNFILWGVLHALLFLPSLILENKPQIVPFDKKQPITLRGYIKMFGLFVVITFTWIVFRMNSIQDLLLYLSKIFSPSLFRLPEDVIWALPSLIAGFFMFLFEWNKRNIEYPMAIMSKNRMIRWSLYLILVASIIFYQGKQTEFIYFNF